MTLHIPTYRTIDVPVYGNPGEVDQIEVEVDAPPEPTDEDDWVRGTAWEDFHRIPPLRPDPADYWLPAHLLG